MKPAAETSLVKSPPAPLASVEVTDDAPHSAEWQIVKQLADECLFHGRMFLRGQVKLGMFLSALKKEHGVRAGRPSFNSADSAELTKWDDLVTAKTGYSARSCREFIRLAEATRDKLKKSKKLKLPGIAKKDALALFQPETAISLTPEEWSTVDAIIGTLTSGETQISLMKEFGLIPKTTMPVKTDSQGENSELTAGELAFHFFEAMAGPLFNARTNPDYKKLLFALPPTSDEEHPISLSTLESETRALLADIEDAKNAAAKPAKGRVIEA